MTSKVRFFSDSRSDSSVFFSWGIRLASFFWSCASASLRALADQSLLPVQALDARVISVGNIQIGGAGKTPLVAEIANEGARQGLLVCILTRGYRGRWEKKGGVLAPLRTGVGGSLKNAVPASECGDEPALLQLLCPDAYLGVGRDRIKQYHAAVAAAGRPFDWVVLDDGFQHWKIKKDCQIVAVTGKKPGEVLFRDSFAALSRVDLVVWTKGERLPFDVNPQSLVRVRFSLPAVPSEPPFWLVTAVADAEDVARSARHYGYRVLKHKIFADHAEVDGSLAQSILEQAKAEGAQVLLTGKDWVKWKEIGIAQEQVVVIEPQVEWVSGREIWSRYLGGRS